MSNLSKEQKHHEVIKKHGEFFCAAPWNSLHEGPGGLVSTCCKTRTPIGWSNKQTFEEMFNSDHAKDVRAQFLRGEKPKQCNECWKQEESGEASDNRKTSNSHGFNTIDELVKSTDPDGTLNKHMPEWLDLLWTNKCNFACLGCGPEISSSINNKHRKSFALLNGADPDNYFVDTTNWDNSNRNKIDYIIKHSDTLTSIHLNGGEPFMQEDIYELLEEMLKRNLHKKIKIWSHTNGSITTGYKGKDIIDDYLVHWGKNAKIIMSNDGFGKQGAYIRYGYNDKKWLHTYDKIKNTDIEMTVQTCINVFNASIIGDIGERLYEMGNGKVHGKITSWMNPTLNTRMLGIHSETKQQALTHIKETLDRGKIPPNWDSSLRSAYAWMSVDESIEPWKIKSLNNGILELDKSRGTNFKQTFPELNFLYERLENFDEPR